MTEQTSTSNRADSSLRFLFEEADIRGEIVQLDRAFTEVLAPHQYAPGVRRLLGEFLAAAVLLSTTLKFEGKLVLQARSQGQLPLLMVECSSELDIRGIARGAEQATAVDFGQLLADGQLAITIDPQRGQRYQGVVTLEGDSLATCLDSYFQQSEQLQTRLWLSCDGQRAAGMLTQQLPAQLVKDPEQRSAQWEHVYALASTVSDEELLQLYPAQLLHRLYHEDSLRLFEPRPVRCRCSCSRERCLAALMSLGAVEVEDILQEQGSVNMDCEFCTARYEFFREDLSEILEPPKDHTLH
ncbi:Hsp33 family molecular chaperone HslO [Parahaliea sp. F7430]|uniref:33 kDa chaperonin n=1 Tax=Sediminihaliea albiluteola TaxID=2758564 RepID=A0A7W2YKE7_9GAMM|nr:Hsp33 family molecular chaperone HslO [Sediminihaliea albiluteola]MBA6413253.1 Hsp33 family molecular chaperone HslO [Sediminihaliea albiluteola]